MHYSNCFLKRRCLLFLSIFLMIIPNISLATDSGGNRRDYQFSSWKQLEDSVLSEMKKIQKLSRNLRELREIYESGEEKYHSTEEGGFLGLFDPKKKARKEMDKAHNESKRAEEALQSAENAYLRGRFRYLEVLDTQRTLFELRGRYVAALTTYHSAVAHVERLIGEPLDAPTPTGGRP